METTANEPLMPFRLWPYVLLNLIAAVWLVFTQFHRLQTSDSVVFVLASLYEMRIFFWEQDRIGLLIPLLNSWCRSPYHNLLLQTGSMIFCGLSMPILLARVLTPHRMAPLAVTIANAIFLWLAPDILHENWLLVCNYPSALLFGFFAFTVIDVRPPGQSWNRRALRIFACALLLVIAHWQYFGVVIYLGALVVFRTWAKSGPGAPVSRQGYARILFRPILDVRSLIGAPLVWLALGIISLVMFLVRNSDPIIVNTSHDGIPSAEWMESWKNMIATTAALPGMDDFANTLGGVCGLGLVISLLFERRVLGQLIWAPVPSLLAAATELFLLGTREWTVKNEYHPRYLVAITTTAIVAVAFVGLAPVLSRIPRRWEPLAIVVAGLLLLGGASARYGWPSAGATRQLIDQKCGALTPAVLDSGCEAVGGDYWVVWLAMFHVNMTLYESGEDRVIFGLGYRCEPMKKRWLQHTEGFRILLPDEEMQHVESPAVFRGLSRFEKVGERGTVRLPVHPHAPSRPATLAIYRTKPEIRE